MSIGSLSNIASGCVQSLLSSVLANRSHDHNKSSSASSVSQTTDVNQPSPFAELLSTLQQLQQSSQTQYSQVTQKIAANLTTAATTAQSNGNATAASVLNQLANDFSNASQNNQLPSIQDLAQAAFHHHHHGHAGSGADGTGTSSSSSTSGDLLSQLIASYQSNAAGVNQSTDPMVIITSTLASAGID